MATGPQAPADEREAGEKPSAYAPPKYAAKLGEALSKVVRDVPGDMSR